MSLQSLRYFVAPAILLAAVAVARRNRGFAISLGFLAVVAYFGPTMTEGLRPRHSAFLEGYAAQVRRSYNLDTLRAWATSVLDRSPDRGNETIGREFDPTVVPATIGSPHLFRFVGVVRRGPLDAHHLKLSTGGHFVDFWGLRVGRVAYRCRETRWQFAIAPGICVWAQEEHEFGTTN